jgi:hypothetical protein
MLAEKSANGNMMFQPRVGVTFEKVCFIPGGGFFF